MSQITLFRILALVLLVTGTTRIDAQDTRTQAAMRNMTARLRAAETERDTLQAAKVQSDLEKKNLTDRLDALTKQATADSEALKIAKAQLTERETENAQMKDLLQKLQQSQTQAVDVAKKVEAERVKLAAEVIELRRKVADREIKNLALYKLANEILHRYERFGLGDALAAKEPFTGVSRVKLENLVQDYQDKIADQLAKH